MAKNRLVEPTVEETTETPIEETVETPIEETVEETAAEAGFPSRDFYTAL
jgi:hypothetical protein